MGLEFIGKDPNSSHGESPTVWVEPSAQELVLQGWTLDPEMRSLCLETGKIPSHEEVVRIPARMAPLLLRALEVLEGEQRTADG
ncbi:hypothetical protein AGRA3207_002210 [Actinomadura graeca]|uniref:Uncharacterized protein n=1 Tax=Actinomadura graeca TaxID=2750812 RepID=A0ABX8QRV4_9ACTN|nr:hypothetical protein [Actinomadura graeca]QXJ21363.1 hypothetical protein AGRA3207_002210 [Actinomadura graeca]